MIHPPNPVMKGNEEERLRVVPGQSVPVGLPVAVQIRRQPPADRDQLLSPWWAGTGTSFLLYTRVR